MMVVLKQRSEQITDAYIYTVDKVIQNFIALEDHFKDYPCWADCIPKHIEALKLYLGEAIDLAPESHKKFWIKLKEEFHDWLEKLDENGDNVKYSQEVRQFRKKVMAFAIEQELGQKDKLNQCPICTLPLLALGLASVKCVTKDEWRWEEKKPKTRAERYELLKKYGRDCFLDPDKLKFPVCNKQGCIDCDGLRAAYTRARSLITASKRAGRQDLAKYYEEIANKARELAEKHGCEWVHQEI
jgi:hypothetical protein